MWDRGEKGWERKGNGEEMKRGRLGKGERKRRVWRGAIVPENRW